MMRLMLALRQLLLILYFIRFVQKYWLKVKCTHFQSRHQSLGSTTSVFSARILGKPYTGNHLYFDLLPVGASQKWFSYLYTLYVTVDVSLGIYNVLWIKIRLFFVRMYIDFLRTS